MGGIVPQVEHIPSGMRIIAAHEGSIWPLLAAHVPGRGAFVVSSLGAGDDGIRRWDSATGEFLCSYEDSCVGAFHLAVSPVHSGRAVLAAATVDGVQRWDFFTGERLAGPKGLGRRTFWAVGLGGRLDGQALLVGGGDDQLVHRWDAVTGEPLGAPLVGHRGVIKTVLVASRPNGQTVVVSGDDLGTLRQWDAVSGEPLGGALPSFDYMVAELAQLVLTDGRSVLVGASSHGEVRCWDAVSGEVIGRTIRTGGGLPSLAVADLKEGPRIFTSSNDGMVSQWDLTTGEQVGEVFTGVSVAAANTADGRVVLATGTSDGDIFVHYLGA